MVIVVAMIFSTSDTVMLYTVPSFTFYFLACRHVLCTPQGASLYDTSVTMAVLVELWVPVLVEMKGREWLTWWQCFYVLSALGSQKMSQNVIGFVCLFVCL